MSFAYMPLFTGDYIKDTRHLTPLKHGVYLLFLMHCWDQKGPLPSDEMECAGIANCRSHDEIDAMRYVLKRYFTLMEDGWYNSRIQLEIERSENISRVRSEAGVKGYKARAKQMTSKSLTHASNPHPHPQTILKPKNKETTSLSSSPEKPANCDLKQQALEVLDFLNQKTNHGYRPVDANLKLIIARLKSGVDVQEIKTTIMRKVHDWGDDPGMSVYLRPSTLFRALNFEQYLGQTKIKLGDD